MKKITATLFSILLLICLTACSSNPASSPTASTQPAKLSQQQIWEQINKDAKDLNARILENAPALIAANGVAADTAATLTGNAAVVPVINSVTSILQGLTPTLQAISKTTTQSAPALLPASQTVLVPGNAPLPLAK